VKTDITVKNRISELREERGLSSRALAKMIGTSAPQMSRLERGKSTLSIDWILKIAGALDVNSNEIINLPLDRKFTATCDDALLGSVIGWLLEASAKCKVKLAPKELSRWISYVYKEAVTQPLNFKQTRYLAFTIVKVIQQTRKSK
jgi:transcriptional regulator with XRE-family HTH domain